MKGRQRRAVEEPGKCNCIESINTGVRIWVHAYAAEVVDFTSGLQCDWEEPFVGSDVAAGNGKPAVTAFPCREAFDVRGNIQCNIRCARVVNKSSAIAHETIICYKVSNHVGHIISVEITNGSCGGVF